MNKFFAFSGWVVGIVGFLFSIWAWQDSKLGGYLSYSIHKSTVFEQPRDLEPIPAPFAQIGGKNGIEISRFDFALWNSSNTSIRETDIRAPLTIHFRPSSQINNYKIISYAGGDQENVDIKINGSSLTLRWKIFDPSTGVRILLLVSNSGEQPSITGNFGPSINLEEYKGRPYKNLPNDYVAWGLILAFATSKLSDHFIKHMEREEGKNKLTIISMIVCLLITTVLGLMLLAGPPIVRTYGYFTDRPPPVALIEKRPLLSSNY